MPDVRRACAAPVLGTGSTSPPSNIPAAGRSSPRALSLASDSPRRRPPEPAHIRSWPIAVLTASSSGASSSPARRTARLSRFTVHPAPSPFRSFGSSVFAAQRRRSVSSPGSTRASPPPSLLDGLAADLERLVLVPGNWLASLPPRPASLRARHAARLAALHLDQPIHTVTVFRDDDLPF